MCLLLRHSVCFDYSFASRCSLRIRWSLVGKAVDRLCRVRLLSRVQLCCSLSCLHVVVVAAAIQ